MTASHRGLFAGSFDPYTMGHHAIVKKAATLFEEVYILIAVNFNKRRQYPADRMKEAIQEALRADGLTNVFVEVDHGMVADFCVEHQIHWLVRGLRNSMDYSYEENIAKINKMLNPDLESIYLRADQTAVSSTLVRELLSFHKDVAGYVPDSVYALLNERDYSASASSR